MKNYFAAAWWVGLALAVGLNGCAVRTLGTVDLIEARKLTVQIHDSVHAKVSDVRLFAHPQKDQAEQVLVRGQVVRRENVHAIRGHVHIAVVAPDGTPLGETNAPYYLGRRGAEIQASASFAATLDFQPPPQAELRVHVHDAVHVDEPAEISP